MERSALALLTEHSLVDFFEPHVCDLLPDIFPILAKRVENTQPLFSEKDYLDYKKTVATTLLYLDMALSGGLKKEPPSVFYALLTYQSEKLFKSGRALFAYGEMMDTMIEEVPEIVDDVVDKLGIRSNMNQTHVLGLADVLIPLLNYDEAKKNANSAKKIVEVISPSDVSVAQRINDLMMIDVSRQLRKLKQTNPNLSDYLDPYKSLAMHISQEIGNDFMTGVAVAERLLWVAYEGAIPEIQNPAYFSAVEGSVPLPVAEKILTNNTEAQLWREMKLIQPFAMEIFRSYSLTHDLRTGFWFGANMVMQPYTLYGKAQNAALGIETKG